MHDQVAETLSLVLIAGVVVDGGRGGGVIWRVGGVGGGGRKRGSLLDISGPQWAQYLISFLSQAAYSVFSTAAEQGL